MNDEEVKTLRVRIVDRAHPHFGEFGYLVGNTISLLGTPMTELRLEDCRHGTDGCFVKKGQIAVDTLQPSPKQGRRRATLAQDAQTGDKPTPGSSRQPDARAGR